MKRIALLSAALACGALSGSAQSILPDPLPGGPTSAGYYYENHGQIIDDNGKDRPDIRYYSEKGAARLYFANDVVHHTVRIAGDTTGSGGNPVPDKRIRLDVRFDCLTWREQEHGCGELGVYDQSVDHLNYFLPHCGSGITGVKGYKTVVYNNAFPGIDVRYTANAAGPVMYFVIHPGANPSDIRLAMDGQDQIIELVGGDLKMIFSQQELLFPRGSVYQIDASGNPYPIPSWFAQWDLLTANTAGLTTGSYNPAHALVIKIAKPSAPTATTATPGVQWATYYDETDQSQGARIAVDAPQFSGNPAPAAAAINMYSVQAQVGATFYATPGLTNSNAGSTDLYISKFDGGHARKWATYYGADAAENAQGISVAGDRVYVAGETYSTGMVPVPTNNSTNGVYYQNWGTGMLLSFNKNNGQTYWVTKLGGSSAYNTGIRGMDINGNRLFLLAQMESLPASLTNTACNSPVNGQFSFCDGGGGRFFRTDATSYRSVLMEFNTTDNSLVWATGVGNIYGRAVKHVIVPPHSARTYVVGAATAGPNGGPTYPSPLTTSTASVPLADPGSNAWFQSTPNTTNTSLPFTGVIIGFNLANELDWGTYFGGNSDDCIYSVDAKGGELVVAGTTGFVTGSPSQSTPNTTGEFPIMNQTGGSNDNTFGNTNVNGTTDDFVAHFSNRVLTWSRFFGGDGQEGWHVVAVNPPLDEPFPRVKYDGDNNIILAGSTRKFGSAVASSATAAAAVTVPSQSAPGLYGQPLNASAFELEPGTDAYYAMFGAGKQLKWATHFGGKGIPNPFGSGLHAEVLHDIALVDGHKLYSIITSSSDFTPDQCPPTVTTTPWCDSTLASSKDVFLNCFLYTQINSSGVPGVVPSDGAFRIELWPNPTADQLNVGFATEDAGKVRLTLGDALGRVLHSGEVAAVPGFNTVNFDVRRYPAGIYTFTLSSGTAHEAVKFVKQ